jgi:ADP-heptose:LPS heptosyltransferase
LPPIVLERLADGGRDLTVLVLRFGALGDLFRTLPPVRLIRAALPRARLIWAIDDRWQVALEDHPDVDKVLALPRIHRGDPWAAVVAKTRRWRAGLRKAGADLVLDFHGNLRSGVAGWLSTAPVRRGYAGHQQKEGNRCFTTHHVASGSRRTSRMERNLSLVRALGIGCDRLPDSGLVFSDASLEQAHDIVLGSFGASRSYAVLSPGSSRTQAYKRPPVSLLAAAIEALEERGVSTLVVHGPGEDAGAGRLVEAAPRGSRLAPPTDLRVLGALLRDARVFVGGDSGPLHLACAVGCPVVGLYGPTDPAVNSPWGVPHRAVFPAHAAYSGIKKRDRRVGRFEQISPEHVAGAIGELLSEVHPAD